MMRCEEISTELMEYAEGMLPCNRSAELAEHLAYCLPCRRELDSWRRLNLALRSFPLVREPANLKASIALRIEGARSVPVAARSPEPLLALCLSALLAGLALSVLALGDETGYRVLWQWTHQANLWLQVLPQTVALWLELHLSIDLDPMGDSPILAAALLVAALALIETRQRTDAGGIQQ